VSTLASKHRCLDVTVRSDDAGKTMSRLVPVLGRSLALPGATLPAAAAAVTLLAGCPATVGDQCDEAEATQIAYASDGTPAYTGQALLIASCGGSSYCHTQTPMVPRFGAPADLVFDPLLVEGATDEEEAQRRLLRAASTTHRYRDAVYASVVSGTMPPRGRPPVPDLREAAAAFRTYTGPTDMRGTELPAINSASGAEMLRDWLACRAPVSGRTVAATDPAPSAPTPASEPTPAAHPDTGPCAPVGDTVPRRATELEPTWSSIHVNVIRPSCATAGCHIGASSFNMLDLSDREDAYMALTTRDSTAGCGMRSYVTPGDADPMMSLFIDKLQPTPTCGGRMPPSGLSADVVAVIEEWVMNGAMND